MKVPCPIVAAAFPVVPVLPVVRPVGLAAETPALAVPVEGADVALAPEALEVLAAVPTSAPKAADARAAGPAGVPAARRAVTPTKVVASRPAQAVVPVVEDVAPPAVAAAHATAVGARPAPIGGLVVVATARVLARVAIEAVALPRAARGARATPARPSLVAVAPVVFDGNSSCCALGQTRRASASPVAAAAVQPLPPAAVRVTRQAASTQRDGTVGSGP